MTGILSKLSVELKSWKRKPILPLIIISLVSTFIDYANLGERFNLGKTRAMFLVLVPLSFYLFKKVLDTYLALFAATALLSWALLSYPLPGVWHLTHIFGVLTLTAFLVKYSEDVIAHAVIFVALFHSVIGIFQSYGIHPWFTVTEPLFENMPIGFIGQYTLLGAFLAPALAPALWKKQWVAAGILLACIALTKSSMTYGATAVVLYLFIAHKRGFFVANIFGGVAAMALGHMYEYNSNFELFNLTGRAPIWEAALHAIREKPLLGGGIAHWQGEYQPKVVGLIGGMRPQHVHSEPLEFAVEYGLLGLAVALLGLIHFCLRYKHTWYNAVVIAILVNGLANFPLHVIPTALLFCIAWCFSMRGSVK